MFDLSEQWRITYPGAYAGILAMAEVANPKHHRELEQRKKALEEDLRMRYAGFDRAALKSLPILQTYTTYYKRFNKSYHVQLQLESVALKGKSLPNVAALVEAMFMAELKNLLLTAGHDLETVEKPVRIDAATGSERYIGMNGKEQQLKADDMFIADAQGVLSSIIYGPDRRTQITPDTRQVLFTVYAPPGIKRESVWHHLENIQEYVLVIAPEAETMLLDVYGTG